MLNDIKAILGWRLVWWGANMLPESPIKASLIGSIVDHLAKNVVVSLEPYESIQITEEAKR